MEIQGQEVAIAGGCTMQLSNGTSQQWVVKNDEGDELFRFPGIWVSDQAIRIAEHFVGVIRHARITGYDAGFRAGADEERERIAYGFNAVFGQLFTK